jgi:hypothetical protein
MNYLKLKKLISYFGNDSQRERVAAGISIPDAEIDDLVYHSIWKGPFFGWYKRKRLTEEEVREIAVMHRMADPSDPVSFEVVEPADELTEQQWTALKAIRQISKAVEAQVTPFWVIGHCGRKQLKKTYARVEFTLDERPYRIELCLELPRHPKALAHALDLAKKTS